MASEWEHRKDYFRQWRKTPRGRAKDAWNHILGRAGNASGEWRSAAYIAVEVRMTRAEFMAWAVPEFEKWLREYPDLKPSVDRRDANGHYELSNLRILDMPTNRNRQRRYRNVMAPKGMAWCNAECKAYKPISEFYKDRMNYNGLQGKCKLCSDKLRKERCD